MTKLGLRPFTFALVDFFTHFTMPLSYVITGAVKSWVKWVDSDLICLQSEAVPGRFIREWKMQIMEKTMVTYSGSLYKYLVVPVALGLVLASMPVFAGDVELVSCAESSSGVSDHLAPILPYRGMYYAPGHGGTGLTLDVDADGFVFAVFYTYDKAGNPYYYLMQGQYKASSPQDFVDTGVLGKMNAQAYISENGECVGKSCSYRSPDLSDAHLPAHLTWTTPRRLHLTLGSQSWDIQGGQYTIAETEMLEGTWATVATIWNGGAYISPPQPMVRVSRSTSRASDFPTLNFAPDVIIYELTILNYAGTPEPVSRGSFISYDPHTGVVVGFYVEPVHEGGHTDPVITSKEFLSGPKTARGYFTDGATVIGEAVRVRLRAGNDPL